MSDYFPLLRRKFGALTLLMACLFANGWIRHQYVIDLLTIPFERNTIALASGNQEIRCLFRVRQPMDGIRVSWRSYRYHPRLIGRGSNDVIVIRYTHIVIPLTILGAWLLLSKTRAQKKPPVSRRLSLTHDEQDLV